MKKVEDLQLLIRIQKADILWATRLKVVGKFLLFEGLVGPFDMQF